MRDKQFYVSPDVYRAYWVIAKARKETSQSYVTPDQIADEILRKHVEDNYPQLFAHQKQVDKLEQELIEQLTKPK